jgi:hypothetical protein
MVLNNLLNEEIFCEAKFLDCYKIGSHGCQIETDFAGAALNTSEMEFYTGDRILKYRASNKIWGANEIFPSINRAWYKFVKLHLLQMSKQNNNVSY